MKGRRLFVALPLALAVVIGSGVWVWAAVNENVTPRCADIVGGVGAYDSPDPIVNPVTGTTAVEPGSLDFTATLADPTCLGVLYNLVVLGDDPSVREPDDPLGTAPRVLVTATVPGDGASNQVNFDVEVNSDPAQTRVCVYLYTYGAPGGSATGKTGAAFDATAAATLLDRAPDGPTDASGESPYCFFEPSQGARDYN